MLELEKEQTQIIPQEDLPRIYETQNSFRYVYDGLWKGKIPVKHRDILYMSKFRTKTPKPVTFYGLWIKSNTKTYDMPKESLEKLRILGSLDVNFLITTDLKAYENFLMQALYGLENPLK